MELLYTAAAITSLMQGISPGGAPDLGAILGTSAPALVEGLFQIHIRRHDDSPPYGWVTGLSKEPQNQKEGQAVALTGITSNNYIDNPRGWCENELFEGRSEYLHRSLPIPRWATGDEKMDDPR